MKISMLKNWFVFATIVFTATAANGQINNLSSEQANIIQILDSEWLTAYDRNDAGVIQKIFAEDARMIHSDGRITDKSDELKNIKIPAPAQLKAKWRVEEIEVRFYNKTAVSIGLAIQEGEYDGQSFARKYRYTNVYVLEKKQWRLVSAQYSKMDK